MRILGIGGGPAGLYAAILMKRAFPAWDITVFERNRPHDTFGFGVVFSDGTLARFDEADPATCRLIRESFVCWNGIEIRRGDTTLASTGHGFAGLARARLLEILEERCRELGVDLRFGTEVDDWRTLGPADLVVAADGVNSRIRTALAAHFRPEIDHRRCRFSWLGTTLPLRRFTFIFRAAEAGLFQAHAYPYAPDRSTFIVECHEDVWRRAGLETASEAETAAFCERLFASDLQGHRLLVNRSIWRAFPTVRNATWKHDNIVLLGDAAHTAHFSVGSGTKLAMEDAIALVAAFRDAGTADIGSTLALWEAERRSEVVRIQRAAQTSLEWFENAARYEGQPPRQFALNLLTRSRRITFGGLRMRDPAFVQDAAEEFRAAAGAPRTSAGAAPPPVFTPLRLRGLTLRNRIAVSPMCQYSARDGVPGDWHLVHLGSRAVGGAGLVIAEATAVTPEGRITPGCTGLWNDAQTAAFQRIVRFAHEHTTAAVGIQLGHAGRKGSCHLPWESGAPLREGAWETVGPSPLPFDAGWPVPRAATREDMDRLRDAFVAATRRALAAGFDLIELHMAHGYLLSSFLSPLSNTRTDALGGSLENRLRFPLEVLEAVRTAWPSDRPLFARISASDWLLGRGFTVDDAVVVARALAERGCDVVDVSSAGNSPESRPEYGRMYQASFADRIRHEAGVPVMAVGGIFDTDAANTLIAAGSADLCAIARAHLRDPYLTLRAARDEFPDQPWPRPYLAGR